MPTKAVITPSGVEEVELTSEEEAQRQIDIQTGIEEAKLDYIKNRKTEYPDIGEQLDMQDHDQLDGTTTWKDAIAKVKSDNPKP